MTSRVRVAIAVGIAVVLAAVAVVAFAAGRRGDSGPRTPLAAPSPSPSGSSEVALATPAPAPSPTVSVRLPDNRGDDPVAAMKEIVRFRDEIFHAPDPDLVRYIYSPECTCYDSLRALVDYIYAPECDCHDDLVRTVRATLKRGWRTVGEDAVARSVHVSKRDHRLAVVRYVVSAPPFDIVDAEGGLVRSVTPEPEQSFVATLLRDGTDRWRVQSLKSEGNG